LHRKLGKACAICSLADTFFQLSFKNYALTPQSLFLISLFDESNVKTPNGTFGAVGRWEYFWISN